MGKAEASVTRDTKYWVGLIGAMVVGGLLALTPAPHWVVKLFFLPPPGLLEELLRKLGDALFIAGVLALLVDKALKEKLLTEFAYDISHHIIGKLLPAEVRDHLLVYFQTPFVRTEWKIKCEIKPQVGTDYVELNTTTEYSVENRASRDEDYQFRVKVEKSWYAGPANSIQRLNYGDGLKENSELVQHSDYYHDDGHGNIEYTRPVKIAPAAPGVAPKEFRADFNQHFWKNAFSPFYALGLVKTTTVLVKFPPGQFDVDLDLTFDKNPSRPDSEVLRNLDGLTEMTWEIKKPMLPGQGFFVRWNRLPN